MGLVVCMCLWMIDLMDRLIGLVDRLTDWKENINGSLIASVVGGSMKGIYWRDCKFQMKKMKGRAI